MNLQESDRFVPLGLDTDPELELALRLEEAHPNDHLVMETLVERYGAEIYRLVRSIYESSSGQAPHEDALSALVSKIFTTAVSNTESFRGEASIRNWLYAITVNTVQRHRLRTKWRRVISRLRTRATLDLPGSKTDRFPSNLDLEIWSAVDHLPENLLIPLVLRYAHRLALQDIAQILGTSNDGVHDRLNRARQRLQSQLIDLRSSPKSTGNAHRGFDLLIQQAADGLLDGKPDVILDLNQHLAACLQCRGQIRNLEHFETALKNTFQLRWPSPDRESFAWQNFAENSRSDAGKEGVLMRVGLSFWKVLPVGVLLLVVFAAIWYLNRINPRQGRPIASLMPDPPPTPVEISHFTYKGKAELEAQAEEVQPIYIYRYSSEPTLSPNGRWIAFSSFMATLVEGDTNEASDIFLYDRETGEIELVSISGDGARANGDSSSPSLSQDGRWVAFASTADNLVPGDNQTCSYAWQVQVHNCMDIYLHDRVIGSTERISLAWDGTQADGDSYFPAISGDGRYVAYWSNAGNLVEGDIEMCGENENIANCSDVFIYDRQTGLTERIPVGTLNFARSPLSISANGRWIALTLYAEDLISRQLDVGDQSNVFVYDRLKSEFEPINLSSHGTPGTGPSINASLSADGRYVAFASHAEDLVTGDTNHKVDVFLRDRLTGKTELVSRAGLGEPGNGDSGVWPFGEGGWGRPVNLSADGRFVIYTSHANNLFPTIPKKCPPTLGFTSCNYVFVYDRETQVTEMLRTLRVGDSVNQFPAISKDGRWTTVLIGLPDCYFSQFCAMILLYDRWAGLMELVDKDQFADLDTSTEGTYLGWNTGYIGRVNSVTFSPVEDLLAFGSNDNTVRVWNLSDERLLHTFKGHAKPVSSVAISPDGTLLASGSYDASVNVWRVKDGTHLVTLPGHPGVIRSLAFSPDGSLLAVGALRAVWIWQLAGEEFSLARSDKYPGSYVDSLAFSPDGSLLAFSPGDNTVWVRRVSDGATVLRLGGHKGEVLRVAFSPDGKYLASGSQDHTVNLWRIDQKEAGALEATYSFTLQHGEWVSNLAFSPDGTLLASASLDYAIRLWTVPNYELWQTLYQRRETILSLAFSSDGQYLAAGTTNVGVRLWRIHNKERNP